MNLKDVLKKKADYPVRLIAQSEHINELYPHYKYFCVGDKIGIEVIDFSQGLLRCCNKRSNEVFQIYYNKENWELVGEWAFQDLIKP
jgi:hypothetical protein